MISLVVLSESLVSHSILISSDGGRQGTTDYEKRVFVKFVIIRYTYGGMNFINNFSGSM